MSRYDLQVSKDSLLEAPFFSCNSDFPFTGLSIGDEIHLSGDLPIDYDTAAERLVITRRQHVITQIDGELFAHTLRLCVKVSPR